MSIADLYLATDNSEVIKFNSDIQNYSEKVAKLIAEQTLNLESIFEKFGNRKTISFQSITSSQMAKNSSKEPSLYLDGLEYEVGIRCYNKKTCDPNLDIIVCIGTEILAENEDLYEDKIAGWVVTRDSELLPVIISEEYANETKNPLFIVVNGVDDETENDLDITSDLANHKSTNSYSYDLDITSEKLEHRYENSGDSEYNVSWLIDRAPFFDNSMGYTFAHIKDIKKTQINKNLSYTFDFYYYDPYDGYYYVFGDEPLILAGVTYEHDWFASMKSIPMSYPYDNIHTVTIGYRASHSNDYYQKFIYELGTTNGYSWGSFDERCTDKEGYVDIKANSTWN
jgi:hypothetical protein